MKALIITILMIASTSAFANIPVQNINHTTIMTKDSMFVLDKKAGTFWKVQTTCDLPIKNSSNIRFVTNNRIIKKGTQVTFLIDTRSNKHQCAVQSVSAL